MAIQNALQTASSDYAELLHSLAKLSDAGGFNFSISSATQISNKLCLGDQRYSRPTSSGAGIREFRGSRRKCCSNTNKCFRGLVSTKDEGAKGYEDATSSVVRPI
jgi:hypothetical protein